MAKAKTIKTNWTAGELSPRLLGRPDLAKYFNGAALLENFYIYPQGGIYRPPGTRFSAEVADSTRRTRLVPFIASQAVAFILEFGHQYIRFYKNGAQVMSGGSPYQISTPYQEADLFSLQWDQSADVLFIDCQGYEPRKLIHTADTNWALATLARRPPPTVEDDTDIGTPAGATLTPSATTGTNILFTASAACFLAGDKDRNIKFGTARAVIVSVDTASTVHADILDPFPNTSAIPAGQWFLDKSPSSYIDIAKKPKLGGTVDIHGEDSAGANQDTWRAADVGKFIKVFGGIIEITVRTDAQNIKGILRVPLVKNTDTDPAPVAGGEWTQEVIAWDSTPSSLYANGHGFPAANTFYGGRLGHGGTPAQPTSWWLSGSDDYENYGVGARADFALQYTNTGRLNNIRWMLDLGYLFLGTEGGVALAKGPGVDQPLGGDTVPLVRNQDAPGTMAVKPLRVGTKGIYIEASGKQVYELAYNTEAFDNSFRATDITRLAEHIGGSSGFKQESIGWALNPNRHAFFIRNDGVMAVLTYFPSPEGVVGWARRTTQGSFESIAVIPHPSQNRDQIWVIVNRTINGVTKRYVEYFEDGASELSSRAWTEFHTDCAKVYSGAATATITGLSHLEGKTVQAVAEGSYKGTFTVTGGQITLPETHTLVEVGLEYDSTLQTMPAAVQDSVLDDDEKTWDRLTLRLNGGFGGRVVNADGSNITDPATGDVLGWLLYDPSALDASASLFTGKKRIDTAQGWDDDAAVRLKQDLPFPFPILSMSGRLNAGDM